MVEGLVERYYCSKLSKTKYAGYLCYLVKYYNMTLQSTYQIYRSFSYRADLRDEILKLANEKSPIKLQHGKRKMNYYDQSKLDIEINNQTKLIEIEDAHFKYSRLDEENPINIKTIIDQKENRNVVSLHAYLAIEDRPIISTSTRNSKSQMNRKDARANDDTGIVKLPLWGSVIN